MKTLLLLLSLISALLCIAATNAQVAESPVGPSTTISTNSIHALPPATPIPPLAQDLSLVIPIVVPALIAGLKSWVPKLPGWSLPIVAPALGALMDWVMQLNGLNTNGAVTGALLGSAGVGLRELHDQVKQRIGPEAKPSPPNTVDTTIVKPQDKQP